MTERLYFDDPALLRFEARVIAHGTFDKKPSVVLDRSAFYPESGGQMGDRGALSGLAVADVQLDDAGVVHHVLEDGALPAIGAMVEGLVDKARRRAHMALHTGQHMLSRALEDVASAPTVSSRLGDTSATIDVDRDVLDEARAAEAEGLVNSLIDDDVAVRAFFPSPEELAALPLRRAPKVADKIRVVMVGDFDVTPCGGTHCRSTAQVGLVKITAIERYKGKARVSFTAGPRARRELSAQADLLRDLGRGFTCAPRDVPVAIDKLRRELDAARETLGATRAELAGAIAERILVAHAGEGPIIATLAGAPIELVRAVAARITAEPDRVALLAGRGEDALMVLAARGAGSRFECGAFVKKIAAAAGGRGGGRPEHAEGRLPKEADFDALAAQIVGG